MSQGEYSGRLITLQVTHLTCLVLILSADLGQCF